MFIYLTALGLSFGIWDLVPWSGTELRQHWEHGVLATQSPGKSWRFSFLFFFKIFFFYCGGCLLLCIVSSSCGKWGPLFFEVLRLLIVEAFLVEQGL